MKSIVVNPFSIDKVKVVAWRGSAGASGNYTELINRPSINGTTLSGDKTASQLGLASSSDISALSNRVTQNEGDIEAEVSARADLLKSSKALISVGSGAIQNRIYLEEGNASNTNLYFKMLSPLNVFYGNTSMQRSWTQVKSNLNVATVTSPNGIGDCLQIPNNYALVLDTSDSGAKYVERNKVTASQIPLFFNAYGRAENLHPTLMEVKMFALEQAIVNVQRFGAFGNGTNDDTNAIQSAIEHANTHGGIVFFPKGTYLLSAVKHNSSDSSLASALMCYSGQTLVGDNAVLKVGSASVTHTIFTYNASGATAYDGCKDITFEGLTFDGNSSLSNSITHITTTHASNVLIRGCTFINGRSWHSIELNSTKNGKVENCVFSGNSNSEDIQIDSADGNGNLGSSDSTVCTDIEISGCHFTVNGYPAIGNHTNAAHSNIKIHDNVFEGNGGTSGYISFVSSQTKTDVYNNTFKASTKGVTFANTSNGGSVHDNRFIDVTTQQSGGVIEYNNIVNDVVKSIFSDKGFTFPKTVSDLNAVMTTQSIGSIVMVQYSNSATSNRPSNDSGICLSGRNTGSGGYGWQIAFTNNGFYWRKYSGNSFQAWTALT